MCFLICSSNTVRGSDMYGFGLQEPYLERVIWEPQTFSRWKHASGCDCRGKEHRSSD